MGLLLLLLLSLAIIGYPAKVLLSRLTPVARDLDLLQGFLLSVYCGGLVLYLLALLPFRAFTTMTAVFLIISCALISTFIVCLRHSSLLANPAEPLSRVTENLRRNAPLYLGYAAIAGLFLLILWIVLEPTDHYILGSIHDTSLHALFTEVIIENGHIPGTLAPYEPTGIVQPIGGHPIFALATYLFDWSAPYAVLRVTPLFIALLVLGGYFLGKCINGRTSFGILLAATLSLVASHPVYMTWGGNAFALAYPLLLMCLGFLVLLLRSEKGIGLKGFLPFFPLFGYLMALHVSVFFTFVLAGGICCLVNGLLTRTPLTKLTVFGVTSAAGLLLIAPFLWRYFAWRTEPGHNIGLPADVQAGWFDTFSRAIPPVGWIVQQVSPYTLLQVLTWLLVGLGLLVMLRQWRTCGPLLLPLTLSVGLIPLLLTWVSRNISWAAVVAGGTTISIGYAGLSLLGAYLLDTLVTRDWSLPNRPSLRKPVAGLVLAALILSPYVYYRVVHDPQLLDTRYGMYAVTTEDDLKLMGWMRDSHDELGTEATVLTNAFEPGMFIPSLANVKTVFPYTGSQNSASYQRVVLDLHNGKLDSDTYHSMKEFGITHLYVGDKTSWWPSGNLDWHPKYFLDNPSFRLVKRFGEAYLFQVVYSDPDVVFTDDFEYATLDVGRWSLYTPDKVAADGAGRISIEPEAASHAEEGVRLESRKDSGAYYWTSMWKDVYLENDAQDSLHYHLCFNMRAVSGFGPGDELMLVVSDGNWDRQLYLETRGESAAYLNPEWRVLLAETPGPYEVDLSQLWYNVHGSSLPDSFYIQIINLDADGTTNVGYLDFITMSGRAGTEPPTVAGISAASGAQGNTLDVAISGSNFTSDAVPSFGPGVTVTDFVVDNLAQITATIQVDIAAATGSRSVSVTTSDGADTAADCFTVVPRRYGVSWNSHDTPTTMNAGQACDVSVSLTNNSNFTWSPEGPDSVNLACHWYDSDGQLVEWDGPRSILQTDLSPGETATVHALVVAPGMPGEYVLKWDLVHESVTWFSTAGCPPLDASVHVGP